MGMLEMMMIMMLVMMMMMMVMVMMMMTMMTKMIMKVMMMAAPTNTAGARSALFLDISGYIKHRTNTEKSTF